MENQIIPYEPNYKEIKTKEDLINIISAYFDAVNSQSRKPTFTGLSMFLGITRQQLKTFPQSNPFYPILLKAKQYIVDYVEQQLYEPKSSAGLTFWLKNNDEWEDKSSLQVSHHKTMKDILEEIDQKNISPLAFDAQVETTSSAEALPEQII